MMDRLTLVYAYYQQPKMLERQCAVWVNYPPAVKSRIQLILVDDGSREPMAVPDLGISIRKFRIENDIPWNWDGARNLAMMHAQGWCLITDLDHILDSDQAAALLDTDLDGSIWMRWFHLERRSRNKRIRPHCNSFVMHRSLFWHVGGYDERLRQYDKDRWFRARLEHHPFGGVLPVTLRAVLPADCPDASVRLARTGKSTNPGRRAPLICNFTWREVA